MLVPLPQVQPLPPREDAGATKRTKKSKSNLWLKHTRGPKAAMHGHPSPKKLTFNEGQLPGADDVEKPPHWLKASNLSQARMQRHPRNGASKRIKL